MKRKMAVSPKLRFALIAGACLGVLLSNVAVAQAQTLKTWAQIAKEGGPQGRSWAKPVDYNLPAKFRNGYVYFNHVGANGVEAYILRQGLSSYPTPQEGLEQLPSEVAANYVKSGKAIYFRWNFGNSVLQAAKDPKIYTSNGTTCWRGTCLTAPYFSQSEVNRILQSERGIDRR